MWYKNATNKKMMESMFPLGFILKEFEITSILFDYNDNIEISLNCKNIPESYPIKWESKKFNAIHLVIKLGEIKEFLFPNNKLGGISVFKNTFENQIHNLELLSPKGFVFKCTYKYLSIKTIEPYEDTRWI